MFHDEARKFEDLIPHLSARSPRADELTMEYACRQATLEFMRDTKIFHDRATFFGQRGVSEYILEIPAEQVIIDILPDGMTLHGRSFRNFIRDGNYNVIQLTEAPVDGACYEVSYSWHITPDACDIPNEVYEKHLSSIIDKAVMLMFTGDRDSSVTAQAFQLAQVRYEKQLDELAGRKLHNYSNGRTRMIKRTRGYR